MGTEGDSFFVVFTSAQDARLGGDRGAKRALRRTTGPAGAVAGPDGMHTGEPDQQEDDYIGIDVHRAARIAATAHGGQIVVSATTRQLVGGATPATYELRDLGWHRLKDITDPEHLFEVARRAWSGSTPRCGASARQRACRRTPTPSWSDVRRARGDRHMI